MEKYYITFRSITYAQKGQRALAAAEIPCSLLRAPGWMEMRGCGYALTVKKPEAALEALRKAGAVWQRVYRTEQGKKPEVVQL